MELFLRNHHNSYICQQLLHSIPLKTVLFMLNGSLILHFASLKRYTGFWFVKPQKEIIQKSLDKESKSWKSCWQHVWKGMKSYLFYGLPLDVFPLLKGAKAAKEASSKGWGGFILERITKLRLNMTCFFLSYVGLYRVSCQRSRRL